MGRAEEGCMPPAAELPPELAAGLLVDASAFQAIAQRANTIVRERCMSNLAPRSSQGQRLLER